MRFFNQRSIEDSDFGTNFALLFTSRYFEPLKEHLMSSDGNCTFRAEILNMLQQNYSRKFCSPTAAHLTYVNWWNARCVYANLTKLFTQSLFLFRIENKKIDAENLKAKNMEHFYNSVYLLGEFYNRLHQKAHPILIMGKSLFELLTKHLRKELADCKNDATYSFDVRFARLLLAQVCANRCSFFIVEMFMYECDSYHRFIAGDIEW